MSEVNVLIVEDEPMVAEDIAEALNNIDFKVSAVVYTEKAALEEFRLQKKLIDDIIFLLCISLPILINKHWKWRSIHSQPVTW